MSTVGQSGEGREPGGLGELDTLEVDECWRLLETQAVGRLAVIVGQYPLVFPVNFAVDGREIVFHSSPGTKLYALQRSNVTFEVDLPIPAGWSVMVQGVAHELLPERNVELEKRSKASGATPWAPGERDHIVRIVPDRVTGRRLPSGGPPDPFDARGYR
jgi:nitroimidazol reductase NimA-like FMN-containing flavoprotein (pyridoxamine 5'-phosphate oxidase superfamily)